MAKPILVIKLNKETFEYMKGKVNGFKTFTNAIKKDLAYEYHVVLWKASSESENTFEVLNDTTGLKDVDIKKYISKLYYDAENNIPVNTDLPN